MTAEARASVPGPGAPRSSVVPAETGAPRGRGYTLRVTSVALDRVLDEAVKADERVPTFDLRVDWNGSGQYNHRFSTLTRMVKSFTFTQELASELPAVIGFVEGTAASKLQVLLGGQFWANGILYADSSWVEDVDSVEAFSPYGVSGPGPVINRALELRTGFLTPEGVANLLRFTGTVTGYSLSAATREVTLDALDPVSRLRKLVSIYAYGVDGITLARFGNFKYPWAINMQWYIDCILRGNGYYASPPPGGDSDLAVTLSATMHGSYRHEIGRHTYVLSDYYPNSTATYWVRPFEFGVTADPDAPEAHPFQMMYPTDGLAPTIGWITRSPGAMRPGIDGWGMSGWVRVPAAGSTINDFLWSYVLIDGMSIQLRLVNGLPHAYFENINGTAALYRPANFALTSRARWVFIGIHFLSTSNGVQITMRFDEDYASILSATVVANNLGYADSARAYGRLRVPFTNFSIWYETEAPTQENWRGASWTPTAYVDPALNWIGGAPDLVNRESYDLIKEIVAAEFGAFYFDEAGKPFFRSRIVDRGWNRPPEVITSDRDITDLVATVDDSLVRNVVATEWDTYAVGGWETVWEPEDPYFFTLAANSFNTWTIFLPEADVADIAETDDQIVKWVSSELWGEVKDNPYYAGKLVFSVSLLSDPTMDVYSSVLAGKLATAQLVFVVRRLDSRTVSIRITSFCPYGIRFATASKIGTNSSTGKRDGGMVTEGEPAFRIPGRKVVPIASGVSQTRHERSVYTYGEQTYDLGGKSLWRQTPDSCNLLGASVLRYTAKPKPVLGQVETPHNPRRKLRDKVILTEPDSLGARIWCTVYGISTVYDENGARDILTLRPDSAPPGW